MLKWLTKQAALAVTCLILIFLGVSDALAQQFRQIVVATGSPFELGLVTALAAPFEKQHQCAVRCIKTPTGPGLDLGRNGLSHITMGHNHEATAKFVKEGFAAKRSDLMYNLTIVVGPPSDPAKIAGLTDLAEVHRRIAEAKAPYLSRGDGGGMDILEKQIWKKLSIQPDGQSWYQVSRTFMLQSLLDSDKNGQYHMLDSSTWALHKAKVSNLKVLVEGPKNEYEMCLVSTEKNPNLKYNQDLAVKFYDYCLSKEGQDLIAAFGVKEYGLPVYYRWPTN